MGGGYILLISPCQPLHALGYPFDCPNIVCLIPSLTSNSQAELSKPTREDLKISKRKQIRSLSEYIPTYQSSLQCHFRIPNHLVSRPATKWRASPLWKNFLPPEKMSRTYCMHNHCFRCYMLCNALLRVINVKFGPPSENHSSPLVSQAGYGSAGDCCCLVTSVSHATHFSFFTIKIFRFNIKF